MRVISFLRFASRLEHLSFFFAFVFELQVAIFLRVHKEMPGNFHLVPIGLQPLPLAVLNTALTRWLDACLESIKFFDTMEYQCPGKYNL